MQDSVDIGEGEALAPICPQLLGQVPSEVQGIEIQLLLTPKLETPIRIYGGKSTDAPVE